MEDAVDVLCRAYGDSRYSKRALNVSNMEPITVKTVIEHIQNQLGKPNVQVCWQKDKPVGIPKKILSNRDFLQICPDYPFTRFAQGIVRTFDWYKAHGDVCEK